MAKKGYDPYNKPTATKPKPKPNPYKASPNNPYNNAGPKVKATSSVKGGRAASAAAKSREFQRAYYTKATGPNSFDGIKGNGFNPRVGEAQYRASKAGYDMARKNADKKATVDAARKARPSKIGWAKAGGPKAGGVKGLGTPSSPGGAAVKWGTAGAKKAAPKMLGAYAKGIAATAGRALGPIGAVATAGQVGYEIGKAANNKWNLSGRIVDAVSPSYNPNDKGRSRTLTKSGSYDSPALKQHLKKKAKKR